MPTPYRKCEYPYEPFPWAAHRSPPRFFAVDDPRADLLTCANSQERTAAIADPLRERLKKRAIELIAPYRKNNKRRRYEDLRKMRRYKR
jgi:hypothetical protein